MREVLLMLVAVLALTLAKPGLTESLPEPVLDTFNSVVGTQTFSPSYQFTEDPPLLETAKAILAMGSNVIKFKLDDHYFGDKGQNVREGDPRVHSLRDLVQFEPTHRAVLELPFAYYIIWVYPFNLSPMGKPVAEDDWQKEYTETRDLVEYLLKTYSGTGKTFFLGHWEGDWHLRPTYDPSSEISEERLQWMVDWTNLRQQAVDDAKAAVKHHEVEVWCYAEVNLVKNGLEDKQCLARDVLPKTNPDFVSYSSYDTQGDSTLLKRALDYIEARLKPKPGIEGKRVFIGEYGFPAQSHTPEQQDREARRLMQAGLEWGCPFILYWELFNNEVAPDGKQRGFWLIDDKGVKQPVYRTHQRIYRFAKRYREEFEAASGRQPTTAEYCQAAAGFVRSLSGEALAP